MYTQLQIWLSIDFFLVLNPKFAILDGNMANDDRNNEPSAGKNEINKLFF